MLEKKSLYNFAYNTILTASQMEMENTKSDSKEREIVFSFLFVVFFWVTFSISYYTTQTIVMFLK
jgi:hypothetical protein